MGFDKKKALSRASKIRDNYAAISAVLISLQMALILAKNLYISITLFLLNVFIYVIAKDVMEEKQEKYAFWLFRISILVFFISLVFIPVLKINGKLNGKSLTPLGLMLSVGVTLGYFAYFFQGDGKEALQNMREKPILNKLGIGDEDLFKPGDVFLCTNTETNTKVLIPYKDRFLHMLVLGPTGSGKTSQILIPMINQDMQNLECGITVLEPKADLAEKIHAMAKHYGRESVYFNPIMPDCPYFNPLYGKEEIIVENMATTFKMLNPDSPQFFLDLNETLIRNALKVLKRMMGNKATLIELSRLLTNSNGQGKKLINDFMRVTAPTEEIAKENSDIASWFMNEYFNEKGKTYEHCSGLRSQVSKITSNVHLRRVLNPPNGENDVDFEKHLEEGGVLAIATAQGELRDLGRFLGYFIILNFQSAVLKRPGHEDTRRPHFLYIDEFQVYSNPGFSDMLTQGRSYRVASHLATQNRALIGMGSGRDGQDFIELVSTNARNVVIFPGGNSKDAKYYSDEFGEIEVKKTVKSTTSPKFSLLNPKSGSSESVRVDESVEARFSASDIIYRQFGEITYRIIKKNSVQLPGVGKVEYIPVELNQKLDQMIKEYNQRFHEELPNIYPTPEIEFDTEEIEEKLDPINEKRQGIETSVEYEDDFVDLAEEFGDDADDYDF